ncbi:hypothetical protein DFH11DRAFT_741436 [Phellopilus nigrolimitatus]|nr:hypothetical protein DFH11DRAFT_741436 [Phellopilus nigrolimitatus]
MARLYICSVSVLYFVAHVHDVALAQGSVQNVTFQNTRRELVYIPELCGATDDADDCAGAWTVVDLPGSSNGSVSTTTGPSPQFADILPQVFFTFRGLALFVKTSDVSNATANLTVSFQPSGGLESRVFAPSRDFWSFDGLDESQLMTVAVTFLPDSSTESPTHLDIDFIKISVSNSSASSSFLPSQTIPASAFTPTFASTVTLTSPSGTSEPSLRQPVSDIVGETFAGFFALLLFGLAVLFRRRRRHKREQELREKRMRAQAAQQIIAAAPRVAWWRDIPRPSTELELGNS